MTLANKVDQFIADAGITHEIVHGSATTIVLTEGGPVPSLAKVIADQASALNVAAGGLLAQTTGVLAAIKATYYGPFAIAPVTRPDSSARQKGDRYFDTVAGAERTWNGAAWYTPNIDPAALAASDGGSHVTVTQRFANATSLPLDEKIGELHSVIDSGAKWDGATDCLPAMLKNKATSNRIHFPCKPTGETVYYVGAFAAGVLDGVVITTEPGVTLSFASNAPYALYDKIVFGNDVKAVFRDLSVNYIFGATPSIFKKAATPAVQSVTKRRNSALVGTDTTAVMARNVIWSPASDTFTAETVTRTTDTLSFAAAPGSSSFRGAFVELGPYETVSAYFDGAAETDVLGIIIRGTAGYSVVYFPGVVNGNYATARKLTGAALLGNAADLQWAVLGQNNYTSFAPQNSVWSVTKISSNQAIIKLNGKGLTSPFAPDCGDIFEIGFVRYTPAAFSISGLTISRRTDAIMGAQLMSEISIFGDSTAAEFPGSWSKLLPQALNGAYGIQLKQVRNYAVVGDSVSGQLALMQANGFGNSYYVVLCVGTNNIQGGHPLANFKSDVDAALSYILAQGRIPVVVLPWLWYTRAQSGGAGQASASYDKGAPYRMAMERIAIAKGCIVVKLTEELPNPDPAYLTTLPGAVTLRDNIHQSQYGHQLYAKAIAQAIADDSYALPGSVEQVPAAALFLNGATNADIRFAIGADGIASISGTMTVSTIADNTAILHLPRYMRTTRPTNFTAIALSAGGASVLGACYLSYDLNTANLSIQKAPVGTAVLILNPISYRAAYL